MQIVTRSDDEIAIIRRAGAIVAAVFERLEEKAVPGMRTEQLDAIARDEILKRGGYPAFKGYKGFPGNICTSINEVIVHGIPSSRSLKEGDIISLDVGVKFRDYYADGAITLPVGRISENARNLIDTARDALMRGIENAVPGRRISDISAAVQECVEAAGFSVVRVFVGHGIGTSLHEEPEIPNFGRRGVGPRIESGMVLAIEPMINAGTYEAEILDDGWTAVTRDRRLSAHFEHTVAVSKDGVEVLTEA